jgi:hypothetical protein
VRIVARGEQNEEMLDRTRQTQVHLGDSIACREQSA